MLASLAGSPPQSQGWEPLQAPCLKYDNPLTYRNDPSQWKANDNLKKKGGASRMQVKREAQKAALARSKTNNTAGYGFPMLTGGYPFLPPGAECELLKRKREPMAEEQGANKRPLVESSWPVELAGFAGGQGVWRLRGGGQGLPEEATAEAQSGIEAEGGKRVDALMAEVASMMENAQKEGGAGDANLFRLNQLESIPSLPRFNSLELADEMFADILKWDCAKGGGETVEVREGDVSRIRGAGLEHDELQKEEFLKMLDPSLNNQEADAIQNQLQKLVAHGAGSEEQGNEAPQEDVQKPNEPPPADREEEGAPVEENNDIDKPKKEGTDVKEQISSKPAAKQEHNAPARGDGKPQRPALDILAQASASFGPTSPVASKDSFESPESPILSSLGGMRGHRRAKFSPPQQEKLEALAVKAQWSRAALDGMPEARQLCAELSIDLRQLKKWVETHRPKEPPQPQLQPGVPYMGWGMHPPMGVVNPAYMSYMAGNPLPFPGHSPWGVAGVPPPYNQMQVPYTAPVLGPGYAPPPFMGAGFPAGAGLLAAGGGAAPKDLEENQELVASAEALGKLLGDRVNTIPPEKLKEILAAWMAHKRNKREIEKATQPAEGGGVKRKEPEPVSKAESAPLAEVSEGSLLQFSIPSLEQGLSNAPSISTLLAEELAAAAAEGGAREPDAHQVSPGAFKGQAATRDHAMSVSLHEVGGVPGALSKRRMGPLERSVFGDDDDENVQMGPAAESGDDESASSSDDPARSSGRRRAGLRPRAKRRLVDVDDSSGGEEEQQSEESQEAGGEEEELPSPAPVRSEGQWQLATGLEGRRLAPPLGYQGIEGTTGISAVLFEKVLTASDTSHLGRWVLPKLAAERYMPFMEHRDGTFMLVEDSKGGRWCCKYRWWPNNKSKMYVLEQTGDIVKHFKLHPGDTIHFCQSLEGHLMIYEQKKNSKQKAPVACAASPAPLPKRYAKRIPETTKSSPKASKKHSIKAPKAPRSAPSQGSFPPRSYKLPGPIARVSTRGRTIRPSSRLRRTNDNPENGSSPALVYNSSAGQGMGGRLVPQEWRNASMLPPGGSENVASNPPLDPWASEELMGGGQGSAHINELARHFLQQPAGGGARAPLAGGGVPRPLARTGSADLANEILALTSSREMGPRELSPLGAPSRQGSLTPSLQRTKSTESIPFSVSNFPPIPTGLESLSRSSSLNRTASLARAGSLLSRLPSDLEALSKMDNFPSFDFAATPPLPIESAFQPYGGTPGRGPSAAATSSDAAANRRRAG